MSRRLRVIPVHPFRVVAGRTHGDVAKGASGTAYREGINQVSVLWDAAAEKPTQYTGGDIWSCLRLS